MGQTAPCAFLRHTIRAQLLPRAADDENCESLFSTGLASFLLKAKMVKFKDQRYIGTYPFAFLLELSFQLNSLELTSFIDSGQDFCGMSSKINCCEACTDFLSLTIFYHKQCKKSIVFLIFMHLFCCFSHMHILSSPLLPIINKLLHCTLFFSAKHLTNPRISDIILLLLI